MQPELSIILPSIRTERLEKLYDSILASTKRSFELVICGPNPLPEKLRDLKNVKYVKDYGTPVRASNIAASLCEGKVYTWIADDCLLFENTLDQCLEELYAMGDDKKNVLVAKYYEGQEGSSERDTLQSDSYFKLNGTPAASPFISSDWWLFNIAFIHAELFSFLGGWDCEYEGTWASHADMAIRAQKFGANVKMAEVPLFACDHMPGGTGDHMPIFECQHQHDEPLLHSRYRDPDWGCRPVRVEMNNWKNSPAVWTRRFKE
jgi:glycosyltransferase involved in cell wall biosynthesis